MWCLGCGDNVLCSTGYVMVCDGMLVAVGASVRVDMYMCRCGVVLHRSGYGCMCYPDRHVV